jgi:hypothetical protein
VPACQFEQVSGSEAADIERVDRTPQVLRRRGRAGEIGDQVDPAWLDQVFESVLHHVVLDECEPRVHFEMSDVGAPARAQVVDADHRITTIDESVAQVGAEEPGTSGDDDSPRSHRRPTPS